MSGRSSVHLDADEVLVQIGSNVWIFQRLMGHDMTPMAGGIADAEQDGLVVSLCSLKSFWHQGYQ